MGACMLCKSARPASQIIVIIISATIITKHQRPVQKQQETVQ